MPRNCAYVYFSWEKGSWFSLYSQRGQRLKREEEFCSILSFGNQIPLTLYHLYVDMSLKSVSPAHTCSE